MAIPEPPAPRARGTNPDPLDPSQPNPNLVSQLNDLLQDGAITFEEDDSPPEPATGSETEGYTPPPTVQPQGAFDLTPPDPAPSQPPLEDPAGGQDGDAAASSPLPPAGTSEAPPEPPPAPEAPDLADLIRRQVGDDLADEDLVDIAANARRLAQLDPETAQRLHQFLTNPYAAQPYPQPPQPTPQPFPTPQPYPQPSPQSPQPPIPQLPEERLQYLDPEVRAIVEAQHQALVNMAQQNQSQMQQVSQSMDVLASEITRNNISTTQQQTARARDRWRTDHPDLTPTDFVDLEAKAINSGMWDGLLVKHQGNAESAAYELFDVTLWTDPTLRSRALEVEMAKTREQAVEDTKRKRKAGSLSGSGGAIPRAEAKAPNTPAERHQAAVDALEAALHN